MKKLIGLSAAVLITAMAFAQDTIPPARQNFPNTNPNTKIKITDTIPKTNKWNNDTSTLNRTNKPWPDTSMQRNLRDSSTTANNKWPDTTTASATMQSAKDTTAATQSATSGSATAQQPVVEDKVIMRDEKVYVIKNGDSTLLSDSLTLPSGAVVKSDASVQFKDGSTTKLKNGQYISIKPVADQPPAASKTDASTTTTAGASATPEKTAVEDKVIMKDDKVIVIKNGDSTELADSIKLKSGVVVKKDGTVKFTNGTTTQLKNGQFIALNPAAESKKTKAKSKKKEG